MPKIIQTGKQTGKQTDNGDFIGPFIQQGSKKEHEHDTVYHVNCPEESCEKSQVED